MTTEIAAAIIGGAATVVAAVIGILLPRFRHARKSQLTSGEPLLLRGLMTDFDKHAMDDLRAMHMLPIGILQKLDQEFKNHINYFLFDLEDYIMPVGTDLLVYMDKIGKSIRIRRILPCTRDKAELASWSDILALYRKATRLSYRKNPDEIALSEEVFKTAHRLHEQIMMRLAKHFEVFELIGPGNADFLILALHLRTEKIEGPNMPILKNDQEASLAFHFTQVRSAWTEADQIRDQIKGSASIERQQIGGIVSCVERSLQHLHKIMIEFPPIRRDGYTQKRPKI